jgi:two-component system response regulator ChvI
MTAPKSSALIKRPIAVIDDDQDILDLVKTMLELEGYQVITFESGVAALDALRAKKASLIILDIKMPGMDGMEFLCELRRTSELPVMFLTGKLDEVDEVLGLKLGADDFIRKPFSRPVLVERVRTVLRRFPSAAMFDQIERRENVIKRGHLRIDKQRHSCSWKGERMILTVTEFRLLEALASRPGVIKSRDELKEVVCEEPLEAEDRTIDGHIKRLRKKFRNRDETFDRIETVYSVGYRFRD